MISCQTYRASLSAGTQDAALLEHLRTCDACLDNNKDCTSTTFNCGVQCSGIIP